MSKIFCARDRSSLIEAGVKDSITRALDDIATNMRSKLEIFISYMGDVNRIYNPYIKKDIDLRADLKVYQLPLTCTYEDVYNLINQTIKDKLYDRDDSDSNMPVVYVQDVRVYNSEIEIWMTVRLLQTTWDGTTADVSVIQES